jgi:hypothetical protein
MFIVYFPLLRLRISSSYVIISYCYVLQISSQRQSSGKKCNFALLQETFQKFIICCAGLEVLTTVADKGAIFWAINYTHRLLLLLPWRYTLKMEAIRSFEMTLEF